MVRKIKAKLILQLHAGGMTGRAIAQTQKVSRNSVSQVLKAAEEHDLTWEKAASLTDAEVYARLFPEKDGEQNVYEDPDWEHIHKELARDGVTLKRLHAEYRDQAEARHLPAMSYDRFCKRYRDFTVQKQVVSRVGHKAGRTLEVDWAGPTMELVNPATGEVTRVHLFVACLPFSRMSYVEATLDMKQDTWLRAHVHAFEYFGGATPCIVPDNAKVAVTKHPKEGEVEITRAYQEMAAHYGAAVLPARVRRPRDKPSVENEVWQATKDIVAALRNRVFTDFATLKDAVFQAAEAHNDRPFSKREGTRRQVFAEQELPLLRALPKRPYEICTWVYKRKVQRNCHVAYRHNYYSVIYTAVGKTVDLRVTDTVLEIYLGGERLATHPLFPAYVRNRYSTHEADLPEAKRYSEWDADRIRRWADRIGPATREVVDRIFYSVRFDEQGFNAALAVLRLSRTYGGGRLERASEMALATGKRSPRYRDIKPILETNQDKLSDAGAPSDGGAGEDAPGYVRGAAFYGEMGC